MAVRQLILAVLASSAVSVVSGAGVTAVIGLHQKTVSESQVLPRQAHDLPEIHGPSKYWYANFSVGKGTDLELLIDTGSTDLLLDEGYYKPSTHSTPYKGKNFTITYEGVNAGGGGFETIKGNVFKDVVSAAGFTVKQQPLGNITSYKTKDAPPKKRAIAGDGIIGFSFPGVSSFKPQSPSWFSHLCTQKLIAACRFGVVFGTNNKGRQVLGKVQKSLFKGDLTVAPVTTSVFPGWQTKADVILNGKVIYKNKTMIMDTGTNNVQAPIAQTKAIFDMLGFHYIVRHGGPDPFFPNETLQTITGFFPCNKPPVLGFRIPAESVLENPPKGVTISNTSKVFNILGSAWVSKDNGNNNCTTVLYGTNGLAIPPLHIDPWLLGQAFYQGHYVDHDFAANTLSFADLKNPIQM